MKHKILVIDDESQIREMLAKALTRLGYEVTTAQSGGQGINKIKADAFSLVLCDVMMPEMDGLATLAEIKQIKPDLPVIMMSGLGTHDRIIEALEKGAADFIGKPLNLIQAKKTIEKSLAHQSQEVTSSITHLLKESYVGLLRLMVKLLETKDPYTKDHCTRVAEYSTRMAQELKLPEGTIEVINYAGIIHDIGKISVPDVILAKPDKLNQAEWAEIKMHPTTGSMIVEQLKLFRAEEPLIRHHHERYDGNGYPDGLDNSRIPLGARILAIADAYDAMTSARPYRKAMDNTTAIKIIKDNLNKQFDPKIAEVFLSII